MAKIRQDMEVVATLVSKIMPSLDLILKTVGGVVFEVFKLGQRRLVEYHPTAEWMVN